MRISAIGFLLVSMFGIGLVGCTPPPLPRCELQGTLLLDEKPVEAGTVSLISTTAKDGPSYGGPIQNGKYRIYADTGLQPGTYRVEIRWSKPTGEKNPDAGYGQSADIFAEAIPAKYNSESTLTVEIREGENIADFNLQS
ncbi:hypothetical protein [Tuwongella immobilis]|uniref:Carboxypeptidase regulatory-like domain-containing protein n=1 Tax=Tuwongella immobilis TaxID=692036 RepID=A0A6C2YMP4_9BACT|nr:hypothetical protein [Tuwongella immobilis]VIP02644.1 Uncharacterized protein OS=Blastopirellula marina DSM 3645 GN=DSM3645_22359 PE=4 SV=1 [Tuwongella immobilis]VTS02021.1 Uncharacterized protein OS=Blastopirellula marina DSM 3645 GN=DSM3645_22359 PE=4 SV=1 [Tuwongella immobilis]